MGAKTVVIKGGHRQGPAVDLFFDGKKFARCTRRAFAPRIRTAPAARFPRPSPPTSPKAKHRQDAVQAAKKYITAAIRAGFTVGAGHSPVHHFYRFWRD